MVNVRSLVTLSAGAIGGVTAFGLALQATGTWHPTNTQAATTVALATLSVSILTVRSGIERFGSDIRWRRGFPLVLSIVIAAGSVSATTGLALLAGQVVRLGALGRGALVVTAAVTALASSIMNVYTDERILRNQEDQRRLDRATGRLFADASTSTMLWNPQDLEVVLFVKALDVLHRDRQHLRLVQTVSTGSPRPHARIIRGPSTDPIWQCYTEGEAVTSEVEPDFTYTPFLFHFGRIRPSGADFRLIFRSKQPHSVWAQPILNNANEVIGALAVQTYSHFTTSSFSPFLSQLVVGANEVAAILGPAKVAPREAVTADTIGTGRPERSARLNLNSDGRPHPLLNAASFFTLIVGLLSFALGLFIRTGPSGEPAWAVVAAATGLTALLVGLVSQMMSATREERVIIVTGLIAGFIGLALGLAYGGFS